MIARREGESQMAYWKRQCEAEPVGPDAEIQERIDRLNEKLMNRKLMKRDLRIDAMRPKDEFGRPRRYEPPYECKR